jgi:ribosomal protein S18 acetylase RimI-like enzyme
VVVIRSASPADAAQIAAVRRDSWLAAYAGIISRATIDRVTALDGGTGVRQSFRTRPWQRMIAAVADPPQPPESPDAEPGIVGYASFGPELDVLSAPWPHPLSTEGQAGRAAELYALYVHPAWWSTGTGRALMDQVLAKVSAAGYLCVTLWVLEDNARARRFYERAGFAPDGARHVLVDLGGVTEIRYRRTIRSELEGPTMAHDGGAAEVAATYFEAWQARDFARLRSVLADDVDFAGPLGQVRGGDECLRGLEGLSRIMTGIEIRKVFTDGSDVLTWYVMATSVAAPVPVANWMQVVDGKITRIRVAFDARGIAGGS